MCTRPRLFIREKHGALVYKDMFTVNDPLLKKTIEVWQPYSKEKLTEDDAGEIIRNISGFFDILASWDCPAPSYCTTF